MNETTPQQGPTPRDVETLVVLGLFLTVFAVSVLMGVFWSEGFHAIVVNIAAGLVLLGCGLGTFLWARSVNKQVKANAESTKGDGI